MFSSETTKLLTALEEREIVWILEGAYHHQAQEYYKYTARARTLVDAEARTVPSAHPMIAMHQDRKEELVSALGSARRALKLADVLNAILKDVSNARTEDFVEGVAQYFRGRDR